MKRSIPQRDLFLLAEKIADRTAQRRAAEQLALHCWLFAPETVDADTKNFLKNATVITDLFQHTSDALKALCLKKPRRPFIATEEVRSVYDRIIQERSKYFLDIIENGNDFSSETKKDFERIALQYKTMLDNDFAEIADGIASQMQK